MSAFQYPLWIKARACVVLSTLASDDVDDDMVYQLLMGLRRAFGEMTTNDTGSLLGLMRCLTKLTPQLRVSTVWIKPMVWFAIMVLGASSSALFGEAMKMLTVTLDTLCSRDQLGGQMIADLLDARNHGDTRQFNSDFENKVHLAFEQDFSFSLAILLFKGVRATHLRDETRRTLEKLIKVTASCQVREGAKWAGDPSMLPMHPETIAYFIALLPMCSEIEEYRKLVSITGAGSTYFKDVTESEISPQQSETIPRVSLGMLGAMGSQTVLLLASFVCTMLKTSSPNDNESVMLYTLLADLSARHPDIVALWYVHFRQPL